jgi:hypothetical protein
MLIFFIGIFLASFVGLLAADRIDHGSDSAIETFRAGASGLTKDLMTSASGGLSNLVSWISFAVATVFVIVLVVAVLYAIGFVWSIF